MTLLPSIKNLPTDKSFFQKTKIPFGVYFRFNKEIPPTKTHIERCKNCKIYINKYCFFRRSGKKWTCNHCGTINKTSKKYYTQELLDTINQVNKKKKQELLVDNYSTIAPKSYIARSFQPPIFIFLLDSTENSIISGLFSFSLKMIKQFLKNVKKKNDDLEKEKEKQEEKQEEKKKEKEKEKEKKEVEEKEEEEEKEKCKQQQNYPLKFSLLLITIDSQCELHLPAIHGRKNERIISIPETGKEENNFLRNISNYKARTDKPKELFAFCSMIDNLRNSNYQKRKLNQSRNRTKMKLNLKLALETSLIIMDQNIGKIIPIVCGEQCSLRNQLGKNFNNFTPKNVSLQTNKEQTIGVSDSSESENYYQEEDDENDNKYIEENESENENEHKEETVKKKKVNFYKWFSKQCGYLYITIDLILLGQIKMEKYQMLCKYCGGKIYYSSNFIKKDQFLKDLKHIIAMTKGFDTIMRIRSSSGIKIHKIYGNLLTDPIKNFQYLSSINFSTNYFIELKLNHTLKKNTSEHIQVSLIYTNFVGERIITIFNCQFLVLDSWRNVLKSIDLKILINLLTKKAINSLDKGGLSFARQYFLNASYYTCFSLYQKFYKRQLPSSTELKLFSNISLLPYFALSMSKSILFRTEGVRIQKCYRLYLLNYFKSCSIEDSFLFFLPLCFSIFDKELKEIPLKKKALSSNGIYLLFNGLVIYCWVGENIQSHIRSQLVHLCNQSELEFSVQNFEYNNSNFWKHNLVDVITSYRNLKPNSYVPLYITEQNTESEIYFVQFLMLDKTPNSLSYQSYSKGLLKNILMDL
ncbi:sec24-related protein [Anaeramoeba flamelloides]|uniref:Sec24-related protein n=1 Tax=Anaeramoeba flamelloides TaxID=1746091 RepID=A0AAV7YFT2_9EUKA|nr:sec24-related protein [Anaeramoeba flamelloides]